MDIYKASKVLGPFGNYENNTLGGILNILVRVHKIPMRIVDDVKISFKDGNYSGNGIAGGVITYLGKQVAEIHFVNNFPTFIALVDEWKDYFNYFMVRDYSLHILGGVCHVLKIINAAKAFENKAFVYDKLITELSDLSGEKGFVYRCNDNAFNVEFPSGDSTDFRVYSMKHGTLELFSTINEVQYKLIQFENLRIT